MHRALFGFGCIVFAILLQANTARAQSATVSDELFVLHAIQNHYDEWPRDFDNTQAAVNELKRIDFSVSRLRAYCAAHNLHPAVMLTCDSCRTMILKYENYLREIGAIDGSTQIAAANDGSAVVQQAFRVGTGAYGIMSNNDYKNSDAIAGGLLAGLISAGVDGYQRSQARQAERERLVNAAVSQVERAWNDTRAATEVRVRALERDRKWSAGAAGHDGFATVKLAEAIAHRPDDLFLKVRNAAIRVKDESSESLLNDARACQDAAATIPPGSSFDHFRADFTANAASIATLGAVQALQGDGSYSSGPSIAAPEATAICNAYLSVPGANKSFGSFCLARSLAANKQFEAALAAANAVDGSDRDMLYHYIYAKLCCLTGNERLAIPWLRNAFLQGHAGVSHAKKSDDFVAVRRAFPKDFAELVEVKWEWSIDWGYRIADDTITITNNSGFPLTNVIFNPVVSSAGYSDWTQKLTCQRIEPGASFTWKLGVGAITSRGSDAKGRASISVDQL